MREEHSLKHTTHIDANRMFLSFLHDMDENVESYIETVTVLQNPKLMQSISRGLRGKGIKLEEFLKKQG